MANKTNDLLNEGEEMKGTVVMRGNVPVATIVAGRRIPLKKGAKTNATENVLKQKVVDAGERTYLMQRVQVGSEELFRWSQIFIKTDEETGMPLDRDGYTRKGGAGQYRTAEIDGQVVGLKVLHEGPDSSRAELVSTLQGLA